MESELLKALEKLAKDPLDAPAEGDLTADESEWWSIVHNPNVKRITKTQVFYEDGGIGPTPYTKKILENAGAGEE